MPAEPIVTGSDDNWTKEVSQSSVPVLVDFWAAWCGPCRMVSPTIEKLANKYKGKLKVVKVNVDENPDLAMKFNVMSIPTILLFDHGKAMAQQIGAAPAEVFESMISNTLKL